MAPRFFSMSLRIDGVQSDARKKESMTDYPPAQCARALAGVAPDKEPPADLRAADLRGADLRGAIRDD